MQLSKTQVQAILNNAPPGVDKTKVLDGLVQRGYQLEGVDTAQAQASIATRNGTQALAPQQQSGFNPLASVGQAVQQGGDAVHAAFTQPGVSSVEQGVNAAGAAAGAVPNIVASAIPGGKEVMGALGSAIGGAVNFAGNINDTLNAGAVKLGIMSPQMRTNDQVNASQFADSSVGQGVDRTAQVGQSAGNVANLILAAKGTADGAQSTVDTVAKIGNKVGDIVKNTADQVVQQATDLRKNVQTSIASKNVNPQLQESVNRLFLDGTAKADPVATYDSYLSQSKNALTDIKVDPAIATVGEDMGNAFNKVIAQRRAVGQVLGDELKTVGKLNIDITEPRTNLLSELKDSGLAYNPKSNSLTSFTGSKFAPQEVAMLEDFTKGIQALGDNPTVSQIDQFISKTRANLQFAKGSSGVIGTTNAERIINGGLAGLKDSLNPANNGLPALSKYWNANQTYSDLSTFVEDGSGYLGKLSQSGDYVKDASVAKSAVQSILNNGKKDFMIRLEALTGYPALDKAVLALQAMKDAGDFRGLSMLQQLSEGAIPTSKAGVLGKILDYGLTKSANAVAGSAEEQTRAFLKSLEGSTQP